MPEDTNVFERVSDNLFGQPQEQPGVRKQENAARQLVKAAGQVIQRSERFGDSYRVDREAMERLEAAWKRLQKLL